MCVPTYAHRRFQRSGGERLAATSRTYTGARARTYRTHVRRLLETRPRRRRPGVTDFSRPRRARATSRVCRNHSRRSRRADYGPRDLSAPRDTSSRTRLFRARARARSCARPRDREFRPVTQEFRPRLVRTRVRARASSGYRRDVRIWIV